MNEKFQSHDPNPYAVGGAEMSQEEGIEKIDERISSLSHQDVKRFYRLSSGVNAVAGLLLFLALVWLLPCFSSSKSYTILYAIIMLALVHIVLGVLLLLRIRWSCYVAIPALAVWFYTPHILYWCFAASAILTLVKSGRLFGPHRMRHSDLKKAYIGSKKSFL